MRKMTGLAIVLIAAMISMTTLGASDTATTNATFVVPSWISLTVVENGSIDFPEITGPGTYAATADARLRVLSTKAWSLTQTIDWGSSTIPTGADQDTIDRVLIRTPDLLSESWGLWFIDVSYSLLIAENDLANMPEGTYSVIVQYTATTQ